LRFVRRCGGSARIVALLVIHQLCPSRKAGAFSLRYKKSRMTYAIRDFIHFVQTTSAEAIPSRGASRSEFKITMIAGGNHTTI